MTADRTKAAVEILQPAIQVRVLWGAFGPHGAWTPNPHLSMSAVEQWRQNALNGVCVGRPLPPEPAL